MRAWWKSAWNEPLWGMKVPPITQINYQCLRFKSVGAVFFKTEWLYWMPGLAFKLILWFQENLGVSYRCVGKPLLWCSVNVHLTASWSVVLWVPRKLFNTYVVKLTSPLWYSFSSWNLQWKRGDSSLTVILLCVFRDMHEFNLSESE